MSRKHFLAAVVALGALLLSLPRAQSQAAQQTPTRTGEKLASVAHKSQPHEDEGQRLFDAHCARCHTAPEGFSPSISGTIVRHMRVRASLSQHDEQELLRFFNP